MIETVNRAFMYGESVFTTFRLVDGVPMDWDCHFDRLKRGVEFLYGPFTDGADWQMHFKNRLEARMQGESGDKVIRLTVYREQERGLHPTSLISIVDLKTHLSCSHFDKERMSGQSIRLRSCPVNPRPHWWPSFLKAGNYLDTIIAQRKYLQEDDDDLLFLSGNDIVQESSVANIFSCRHDKLYTAPAGPHVLEGVTRKKILDIGCEYFKEVHETETTMEQLMKADGVFGCNSVRGIFLIDKIDGYNLIHTPEFLTRFESLKQRIAP